MVELTLCRRVPMMGVGLLLAFVSACSDSNDRNPTGPSESVTVHDTLNPPGGTANTDYYGSMRSGGTDSSFYDDFVSPTSTTIRAVAWQGGYTPATPSTQSFYIAFFADNGGHPRLESDPADPGRPRALFAATYPVGQTNESFDAQLICTNQPMRQCALYSYSVTLDRPFTATAGVRYWLMIQAQTTFPPPAVWGWRRGLPDNQRSRSHIADTTHLFDLAFALQ